MDHHRTTRIPQWLWLIGYPVGMLGGVGLAMYAPWYFLGDAAFALIPSDWPGLARVIASAAVASLLVIVGSGICVAVYELAQLVGQKMDKR